MLSRFSRAVACALLLNSCALHDACAASKTMPRKPASASWHTTETANFRIYSYGTSSISEETARACESLRAAVVARWSDTDSELAWQPKCTLVLHSNAASYRAAVGRRASSTVASCLIASNGEAIDERRIDVQANHPHWRAHLPHELTHVWFCGRLQGADIPRWADEGMAVLADPAEKQAAHRRDLQAALARREQFRLVELFALVDYPGEAAIGTFYGQSLSVVEFLVARGGHQKFTTFLDRALQDGYDAALHANYGLRNVAELEKEWQRFADGKIVEASNQESIATALVPARSASVVVPPSRFASRRNSLFTRRWQRAWR